MKLLFFSPHAAIWVHAFPEALIAQALRQAGHKIIYVTCGRQFVLGCTAMTAHGLSSESPREAREKVCATCKLHEGLLRGHFRLSGPDVANELPEAERKEIGRIMAGVTRENFQTLEVHGAQVGRAALYEFLLEHKKSALTFTTDSEWHRYLVALENALYAAFAAKRIIERENPDAIVAYNTLYGVNRVVCQVGAAHGTPYYSLHAGLNLAHRLQTLIPSKGDVFALLREAVAMWPSLSDLPIDAAQARLATDHFLELLSGRSVFAYSTGRSGTTDNPRKILGIADGQK